MNNEPDTIEWKLISSHYFGKTKTNLVHICHRITDNPLCGTKIITIEKVDDFLLSDVALCSKCERYYNEMFRRDLNAT
jgi:hypothetical protein